MIPLVAMAMALGMYASACSDAAGPTGASRQRRARCASTSTRSACRKAETALARADRARLLPGAALAVGMRGQEVHRSGLGRAGWTDGARGRGSRRDDVRPGLAHQGRRDHDRGDAAGGGRARCGWTTASSRGCRSSPAEARRASPSASCSAHTAGTRAGASDMNQDAPPADVRRYLVTRPLALKPGEDVLYSDIGFVVLWTAAERAAGEPLPRLLRAPRLGAAGDARARVSRRPRGARLRAHAAAEHRRAVQRRLVRRGGAGDARAARGTPACSPPRRTWGASRR